MFNKICFNILAIFHILIWVYVLLAFITVKTAWINLYIIIPLIYLLHILPFHIITTSKQKINPINYKEDQAKINNKITIVEYFIKYQHHCSKFCFASPISPQGMLIFGALTSSYVLLQNK